MVSLSQIWSTTRKTLEGRSDKFEEKQSRAPIPHLYRMFTVFSTVFAAEVCPNPRDRNKGADPRMKTEEPKTSSDQSRDKVTCFWAWRPSLQNNMGKAEGQVEEQERRKFSLRIKTMVHFTKRRNPRTTWCRGPVPLYSKEHICRGTKSVPRTSAHLHSTWCGTTSGAKSGSVSTLQQASQSPV